MKLTMKIEGIEELAGTIVSKLLDDGIGESTFREMYPDAYRELMGYRADMEQDVFNVLQKAIKKMVVDT